MKIFPDLIITTLLGLVLAFLGILFAFWARIILGTYWSGVASLKKVQILIKNGPYNLVRHPIYSGLSFAVIGSTITENALIGLIAVLLILLFSYFRIKTEERQMKVVFGKEYEVYSKRVKAFIPWLL